MMGKEDVSQSRVVSYGKNQPIILNSGQTNRLYEIISGGAKLYGYSPSGEDVLIDVAVAGDFIESHDYSVSGYEEFAITLVETQLKVHFLLEQSLENQLQNPVISRYIKYLSKRTAHLRRRLINTCSSNANTRLSYTRKFYDLEIRDSSKNPYRLIDLLSQKELGQLGGVTRQTVKKYNNQLLNISSSLYLLTFPGFIL
ncbi:MAG: Crp/Fnr family transcriptional regulator [Bacteroidales bacterium]|nr:Crp/Fnr family transcriptional regulator [Bacteroidales bacterium]MBN2820964.1 Crp/Fnr family transcriptional regulator [Bacteroidales bacterium]